MKNKETLLKGALHNLVSTMIEGDTREWPPTCAFLIYQPERPQRCDQPTLEKADECLSSSNYLLRNP